MVLLRQTGSALQAKVAVDAHFARHPAAAWITGYKESSYMRLQAKSPSPERDGVANEQAISHISVAAPPAASSRPLSRVPPPADTGVTVQAEPSTLVNDSHFSHIQAAPVHAQDAEVEAPGPQFADLLTLPLIEFMRENLAFTRDAFKGIAARLATDLRLPSHKPALAVEGQPDLPA